jgi:hypothetical protein
MKPVYKEFADTFAQALVAKDFDKAHAMLADWLQPRVSAATLQAMVEKEIREVCEANEVTEAVYLNEWRVTGNSCSLESLRDPKIYTSVRNSGWLGNQKKDSSGELVTPVAREFTDEMFRQWLVIQFILDEETQDRLGFDAYMDFWFALAEVNGEYRIGYFEIEDPD